MLLAPSVDLSANGEVGDGHLVLQRPVGEGGVVMLPQPCLNVRAVVRVAISSDNDFIQQSALKRHVLKLFCKRA